MTFCDPPYNVDYANSPKDNRTLLFEAANALLTRSRKPCALKAWAEAIAARCGRKKAKVALARRLAVLLHRLWCDQVTFRADIVPAAAA
jgi:transposase